MTESQAKKLLPIIQAYSEGKRIEVRIIGGNNSDWQDCIRDGINFEFDQCEYRVKPEPREFWLVKTIDGPWQAVYEQERIAGMAAGVLPNGSVIHVREVIE